MKGQPCFRLVFLATLKTKKFSLFAFCLTKYTIFFFYKIKNTKKRKIQLFVLFSFCLVFVYKNLRCLVFLQNKIKNKTLLLQAMLFSFCQNIFWHHLHFISHKKETWLFILFYFLQNRSKNRLFFYVFFIK